MSDTVGDVILARWRDWSVEEVFGHPGDGVDRLLAARQRADDRPQFAQARHEGATFARRLGLVGENLSTAGELGGTSDRALAANCPTVLDARCDPDVPPIPPHATQRVKQKMQQYPPRDKEDHS